MDIPESMRAGLAAWNNGSGIDLESWIGCEGNFSLAVGYATIFWPQFVLFDGYILRKDFSESSLRGFEGESGADRKSVERVMNHLHLDSIQHLGCPDLSKDKLLLLGRVLREIHEAKLAWQFPDRACLVEFYVPPDESDLCQYQISFWQDARE